MALMCAGIAAAPLGPQRPGGLSAGVTARTTGGPAPALIAPAAGEKIQTRASSTTPVLFRWSAPSGAPAPQRYLLCVAESGTSCNAQSAAVYPLGQVTQYQAQVPPRFHDKLLQWTVAACGPGYGGGISIAGAGNTDCTWAQARMLDARYQPQPPILLTPGDGVTANAASQRFTWQARQGQAVDGYRFCLADNISLCRQSSLGAGQGTIIAVNAQRTAADVDIRPLRGTSSRQMHWTVLSCVGGDCFMPANPSSRRFSVPAGPPAPQLSKPAANSIEPVTGTTTLPLGAIVNHNFGSHTYPASINFEWSRVTGATGYKLCISLPGVACGSGNSFVIDARVQGWESPEWSSLSRFHGRAVNWTVASCDAIGCGPWAPPRALTVKAVPGQVALTAPADGADLTSYRVDVPITFTWSAPSFAEWYVFQVGADNSAAHRRVLRAGANQCRPYRPWFQNARGPTSWKVQACNVVGCGPVSSARAITLYPPGGGVGASSARSGSGTNSAGSSVGVSQRTDGTCP